MMIYGYSTHDIGSIVDIVKIEYTSNEDDKLYAVQYRNLDYGEKDKNTLLISQGFECIHNPNYTDTIFLNTLDDTVLEYSGVEGVNENNTDGLYEFVSSNETKSKNYTYVDGKDTYTLISTKIYSQNFERIGTFESTVGQCQVIKQHTDKYRYRVKYNKNEKIPPPFDNEKVIYDDEYVYYYSDKEKENINDRYILYISHPMKLKKCNYKEGSFTEKTIEEDDYNGIEIVLIPRIAIDKITNEKVMELCKKIVNN